MLAVIKDIYVSSLSKIIYVASKHFNSSGTCNKNPVLTVPLQVGTCFEIILLM